jgi:hypothetical protein
VNNIYAFIMNYLVIIAMEQVRNNQTLSSPKTGISGSRTIAIEKALFFF